MFRSVSQDAALPQPMAGRRRTRAQARLEIHERREKFKRAREAMEAQARARHQQEPHQQPLPPPPVPPVAQTEPPAPPVVTPTKARSAVVVGASFGAETLPVECTPVKRELMSPPQIRRISVPPGGSVPTVERTPAIGLEPVASKMLPTTPTAAVKANETLPMANEDDATAVPTRRLPVRGIAQSSSSSTRKRMISFSPERAERPVNEAFEQQKRQRNLKVTEKLQLRLEGIPVKTPEKAVRMGAALGSTTPAKSPLATPPVVLSLEAVATPVNQTLRTDTPSLPTTSRTMELISQEPNEEEQSPSSLKPPSRRDEVVSCKKELDFAAEDGEEAKVEDDTEPPMSQGEVDMLSQETIVSSQQSMEDSICKVRDASDATTQGETVIGFGTSVDEASMEFTSTSTIEDVGLFNCETDAEYSGGIYGEGTDGKVTAAMVRGQKVALKRAKPHEGFPEDEAKRRSAFELHYLRKVRHLPGFVQCLGLCDAIEHTCIALEVMDCKLSEYLRRYGRIHEVVGASGGAPAKRRRRITLPFDVAKGLIKQICQPMIVLHEQVNVAHGDLACRNILMRLPPKGYEQKWEPVLKLSDFGRLKTAAHEPTIFDRGFSFYKNCDVGSFAREILFRLLVGEIVPTNCTETRNLHKQLSDVVVTRIPDSAKQRLGPFYRLFMRCAGWGVRPTFREILEHLDDLEYFETTENGLFPLRPATAPMATTDSSPQTFMSPVAPSGDAARGHKLPSSDSKGQKYDTPTTVNARPSAAAGPSAAGAPLAPPRLVPSKSYTVTDVNASSSVAMSSSKLAPKTVNWLKARSVLSHPAPMHKLSRTTTTSSVATVSNGTSGPASSSVVAHTPMVGRPAQRLSKKTPPSAGASRRSLQILNQIQHRLHEQERKQQWKN
ncbi:hypothetical protein P43SY_004386 [Pythium insidiosum]|uniref:Protein kinase domain-containing protein n=1 Tax=Pythium insidiosum TaxID=114742 RepID=A0AAD5LSF9_PYTIN|nr:hypothetical protein P43SY_004386 [Pythium insidiosum]